MIGYNCKYTPVEILAGFGEESRLLNDEVKNFDYSSQKLHQNLCSHAKAMLEEIHDNAYSGLLFVNCCDSSRRVYDAVAADGSTFAHCIDLPSCGTQCAAKRLKSDLKDLIEIYSRQSGKKFSKKLFLSSFSQAENLPDKEFIAIIGARCSRSLMSAAKKCFEGTEVMDLTCAGKRNIPSIDASEDEPLDSILLKYAKALLSQTPCMRMQDIRQRETLFENKKCIGIIYSTIKFCDYYDFEYSKLRDFRLPILRIETDFTDQSYGQLMTRLEGFRETIDKTGTGKRVQKRMDGKYFAGIDSGSTSTELVIIDKDLNIIKQIMVKTGANAAVGAQNALEKSGIDAKDIAHITATGYGRKNIGFADSNVTEITCHAKGAKHLYAPAETIIDIGGQDSKIITLDKDGAVTGFVMNDKCAAGTGRFLENMAKVLELDMNEMASIGLKYKNDLTISSMCTVFAESEVVSLIAENHKVADIVHGLNKSVAVKIKALAAGAKSKGEIIMTGGVANNKGVVKEIEKQLERKVHIPKNPEFCGALGAALIAAES